MIRSFLFSLLLVPCAAAAMGNVSLGMLTPRFTSVVGGESRVYSVRALDPMGQPASGEDISFFNDACGTFENGLNFIAKVTDAAGVASARFTARPQGITCQITAVTPSTGKAVEFGVLTYNLSQVEIDAIYPAEPRPGGSFSFTTGAHVGAYYLFEADISARVVPGTGSASLATTTANSGQAGRVTFQVAGRESIGDYEIEVSFRDRSRRFKVRAPSAPLQDMWWSGPAENGWGMSLVQHEDRLFGTLYAYDAAGKATWYVMPGGSWDAQHTAFTGALYVPHGSPYSAYDASKLVVGASVGSATLRFGGVDATLEYTIDGVAGRKALSRQEFGPVETRVLGIDAGDMWWGGAAQNGWGVALLAQYHTIFGVWFTYDANGAATWFVMPSGYWSDASTWQGRLYRTAGSPWLGQPYDVSRLSSTDVGVFSIRFDGSTAIFTYTVDGKTGMMSLMRQPF